MERESAVREILQSIGPLFPEDAARARAARKQPETVSEPVAEPAAAQAPVPRLRMTTAPKPVLASQVNSPNTQKTEVADLAAVLERLTVPPVTESVRDAVPELVRPVVPDLAALRAALDIRDGVTPKLEPGPLFTELLPAETTSDEAAAVEPEITERAVSELTEDEHDAFVAAVAEAILPPQPEDVAAGDPAVAEPGPEPAIKTTVEAEPVLEMGGPVVAETAAPVVEEIAEPVATPVVAEPAVEATPAAQPKSKFKRHKPKKEAQPAAEITLVPAAPEPESEPAATTSEDDELVRQIRTHRADMIDVDDQLAKLDQDIAGQQLQMAQYVALVEQKSAYRSRLLRLRTSTQRFVETLQLKAEPVKRSPKKQAKSA